jgi:hypothetical protein
MMVSDTPNLEWTDGVDTYAFPRWWALRPGESEVLETFEFNERQFLVKDYNNRWRPKLGAQVRIRALADEGGYLADVFINRELVGVTEYEHITAAEAIDIVLAGQDPEDVRYVSD